MINLESWNLCKCLIIGRVATSLWFNSATIRSETIETLDGRRADTDVFFLGTIVETSRARYFKNGMSQESSPSFHLNDNAGYFHHRFRGDPSYRHRVGASGITSISSIPSAGVITVFFWHCFLKCDIGNTDFYYPESRSSNESGTITSIHGRKASDHTCKMLFICVFVTRHSRHKPLLSIKPSSSLLVFLAWCSLYIGYLHVFIGMSIVENGVIYSVTSWAISQAPVKYNKLSFDCSSPEDFPQ